MNLLWLYLVGIFADVFNIVVIRNNMTIDQGEHQNDGCHSHHQQQSEHEKEEFALKEPVASPRFGCVYIVRKVDHLESLIALHQSTVVYVLHAPNIVACDFLSDCVYFIAICPELLCYELNELGKLYH